MPVNQYVLTIFNDDNTEKSKTAYKSIRQMSQDCNIPYHTLSHIAQRENTATGKYKNTITNALLKKIKIERIINF